MPVKMSPADSRALARAAGWDVGNAHMTANGRTAWNADDYQAAVDEYCRLCPEEGK
jgi:hypothetical protein